MSDIKQDTFCESLDKDSKRILELLREREAAGPIKPGDSSYPKKRAILWAVDALDRCGRFFNTPPPPQLVELIAHLFGVSVSGYRDLFPDFNDDPYNKAALYLAEHPDASTREIGKVAGRSHTAIENWKADKRFKDRVKLFRKLSGLATS